MFIKHKEKYENTSFTLTQRLTILLQTYSVVYRFEEGRLRKLQLLKTENPKYSVTYRFENTNYVVIVEERSCKLYVWNGKCL